MKSELLIIINDNRFIVENTKENKDNKELELKNKEKEKEI